MGVRCPTADCVDVCRPAAPRRAGLTRSHFNPVVSQSDHGSSTVSSGSARFTKNAGPTHLFKKVVFGLQVSGRSQRSDYDD
jgi:hypothetical protein